MREYKFFNHPTHPNRRYDFFIQVHDHDYLLEYDGAQHFRQHYFGGKEDLKLDERITTDVEKMIYANQRNYRIIRIDYTHRSKISILNQLEKALSMNADIYYSNLDLYAAHISKHKTLTQHLSCNNQE
jgi:hypothetical protein